MQPVSVETDSSRKTNRIAAAAVIGILGIGGAIAIAGSLGGDDSGSGQEATVAEDTAAEDTAIEGEGEGAAQTEGGEASEGALSPTTASPTTASTEVEPDPAPADPDPGESTTTEPGTETAEPEAVIPDPAPAEPDPGTTTTVQVDPTTIADDPVRSAIFSDGTVILQGRVPSQEIADEIVARTALIVGPENVLVAYEIDPDAPNVDSAPLFVEDLVLFETGGTAIAPDFEPLLGLGVVLLAQNENVEITISGHTDSDGTAESNQQLSEDRVQSIIDYIEAAGGDISRLIADPRGESKPIADNSTAEGRQQNRRVEFIITGFVD